ncbi:MAG: hypothetical protein RSD74_12290 [Angelakisella sp.]
MNLTSLKKSMLSLFLAVTLIFQAIPPIMIAEAASLEYFGDGSDGALYIAAGQTVVLPVPVPYQSVVEMNYTTVTIEAGGVLKCAAPNAGLILRVQGACTVRGTIDQSAKAPLTNPNNTFAYPPELRCGNGGNGGSGGIKNSTGKGGTGQLGRPYGGGYSGGGIGGSGRDAVAASGNGGSVDTLTVAVPISDLFKGSPSPIGQTRSSPGIWGGGSAGASNKTPGGGAGGTGPGANGGDYTSVDGYAGGGGAGNIGGGVVVIYADSIALANTTSPAIVCNGGNGGNGGIGWVNFGPDSGLNAYGGGGAGGGGAGGGSVYIMYKSTISQTSTVEVKGGKGGVNGLGYPRTDAPDWNGYPGTDGTDGTITITRFPDITPPVISSVTVPTSWGQTNLVTINATDDITGVKEYAVAATNVRPTSGWQTSSTFSFSDNGTFFAFARDSIGNVSGSKAFTVSRVDTINPVITDVAVTPTGWTGSSTKTITVTATDGQSGVDQYGITTNIIAPTSWQSSNTFATSNGTYYVWAKDKVGRVSAYKQVTVSQIDTTKPVVNSVNVPDEWATDSTVTVHATDSGSGVVEYAVTSSATAPTGGWQSSSSFTITSNGSYYAWVRDTVGNVSTVFSFTISKVDAHKPTVDNVDVPDLWAADSTVTVHATDSGSGVTGYAVTSSATAPTGGWQSSGSFTITSNGSYYAWAKDAVGEVSTGFAFTVDKVDADKPTVDSVDVSDEWVIDNTVTVHATDSGSGVVEYTVTSSDIAPTGGWQPSSSFTITSNGSYYAWARDGVGNVSTGFAFTIDKIDTDKPTIDRVDVPRNWATDATVTLHATDGGSGIAEYAVTSSATAPADGWQSSNSFTVTSNGTYFAWAKDAVGNMSIGFAFTVNKVDTDKPTVGSVEVPDSWAIDSTVTVHAIDSGSGVVEYAVISSNTVPTGGWQSSSNFTITSNGTYYAWAKDKAGNVSTGFAFTVSKVDNEKPAVDIVDVPDSWAIDSTVTLHATDSGSGVVEYAVTSSDTAPVDGWQSSGSFTITSNGSYYAWAKDAVGNVSIGFAFTVSKVDSEKPAVDIVDVPDSWAIDSTVTVQAKDSGSGVVGYAITIDKVPPNDGWQPKGEFALTSNGVYYAWAKNATGTVSEPFSFKVSSVDKLAPIVQNIVIKEQRTLYRQTTPLGLSGVTSEIPDQWAKTVSITIEAIDTAATQQSGCSGMRDYALTQSESTPSAGWQSSNQFTLAENGVYYAWARDMAGNVSCAMFQNNKIKDTPPNFGDGGNTGSGAVIIPDKWMPTADVTLLASSDSLGDEKFAVTTAPIEPDNDEWQDNPNFMLDAQGIYYAWMKDRADHIIGPTSFELVLIDNLQPYVADIAIEGTAINLMAEDAPANSFSGQSGVAGYALLKKAADIPEKFALRTRSTPELEWQEESNFQLIEQGDYLAFSIDAAGNISEPIPFTYTPPSYTQDDDWNDLAEDFCSGKIKDGSVYTVKITGELQIPVWVLRIIAGNDFTLRILYGERYIWAIHCSTISLDSIPDDRISYYLTIVEEPGGQHSYPLPYYDPKTLIFDVAYKNQSPFPFRAELSVRIHYSFADLYLYYDWKGAELVGGVIGQDKVPDYLKKGFQ